MRDKIIYIVLIVAGILGLSACTSIPGNPVDLQGARGDVMSTVGAVLTQTSMENFYQAMTEIAMATPTPQVPTINPNTPEPIIIVISNTPEPIVPISTPENVTLPTNQLPANPSPQPTQNVPAATQGAIPHLPITVIAPYVEQPRSSTSVVVTATHNPSATITITVTPTITTTPQKTVSVIVAPSSTVTSAISATPTRTPTLYLVNTTTTSTNTPSVTPTNPVWLPASETPVTPFVTPSSTGEVLTMTPSRTPSPTVTSGTPATPTMITGVPTSSSFCNWASFVKDMTVTDNTRMLGNTSFSKIWRIKNIGSCTWTPTYKIINTGGNLFGASTDYLLNDTVPPGDTVDISIPMISPFWPETYISYWKLQSPTGEVFGLGTAANRPFYVKIVVESKIREHFALFDEFCNATWGSATRSPLRCPTKVNEPINGSVNLEMNPILWGGGQRQDQPTLITIPNDGKGGYIKGVFPPFYVQKGNRFSTTVGCIYGKEDCNVNFTLAYLDAEGVQHTLYGPANTPYESLDIDLAPLVGKDIQFVLIVDNNGSSYDDYAFWLYPTVWMVNP